MATKSIIKLTNTEAIVKVYGAVGAVTIDLDVDLKLATEDIVGTPKVNIVGMQVTGKVGGTINITRNSVGVYDVLADQSPVIDLLEFGGTSDSTENASDIVVTTAVAESQILLKVRKISGFKNKIRPEERGHETPV